MTRAKLALGHS